MLPTASSDLTGALHRCAQRVVRGAARALTPEVAARLKAELARCESAMRALGWGNSSTVIGYAGGDVQGSLFRRVLVVDRKQAYFGELQDLDVFPWLRDAFLDLASTLRSSAQPGTPGNQQLGADLRLLCGGGDIILPARLKDLYKIAYGTLGNARQADPGMRAERALGLKWVAEIVRRRNALVLLRHKAAFDDMPEGRVLGFFTDSLVLQGVPPATALRTLGAGWGVEFEAEVAVFGSPNCHLMLSAAGQLLVRPRQMLTGELAQWNAAKTSAAVQALRAALVQSPDPQGALAALAALRVQFPHSLRITSHNGNASARMPSVRRLLNAVAARREQQTQATLPPQALPPQATALRAQAKASGWGTARG